MHTCARSQASLAALSGSRVRVLALAAGVSLALATARGATAQTIRGYGFDAIITDKAHATADWREPCREEEEGRYKYQFTLAQGLYTEMQSVLAGGGQVRIVWQTETILSPRGNTMVAEESELHHSTALFPGPGGLHGKTEEESGDLPPIHTPAEFQLTGPQLKRVGVGGTFTALAKGTASAQVPDALCGDEIESASAEWRMYLPPPQGPCG